MIKSLYYVALKYDYAQKEKGYSYEHDNMEHDIASYCLNNNIAFQAFHPDEPGEMDLLEKAEMADVIFHVGFNDSWDLPLSIAQKYIAAGKRIISWDCDSSYRFNNWILPRKNRYTHFVTTHSSMVDEYKRYGMKVIRSQWAIAKSHYDYANIQEELKYPVSFVGQKHGVRELILKQFYAAGIEVHLFGDYWEGFPNYHGRLGTTEEIVKVFKQSKINLNLQNPWQPGTPTQIKGRIMQIPACKTFQLATHADDIERYFEYEKEIVVAKNMTELINYTKYYLQNDEKRLSIAQQGYDRCMKDHTWTNRLDEILKEIYV